MDKNLIEVGAKDLNPQGGIHCPSPLAGMQVQDTHPRVYLSLAHSDEAKCPYCGRVYRLRAGEQAGHGH